MSYNEFIHSIKESRENKYFKYSERHHIIPRCLGGSDDEDNLIYLTYEEHFTAHILLHEEHPESKELLYAVMIMSRNGELQKEEYAHLKKEFSDSQRGNKHALGRKASPAELERRSKSLLGHAVSPSTREKISLAKRGSTLSESTKKRISISLQGNQRALGLVHTTEFIESQSSRMKGNKYALGLVHTEETKKKISDSMKGRKFPNRRFHLICKQCNNPFLGTGVRQKYCNECREVLSS